MDEVINYVMETPGNTNPRVLEDMLSSIGGQSTGGFFKIGTDYIETEEEEFTQLNKTWQEIWDAYINGLIPVVITPYIDSITFLYLDSISPDEYSCVFCRLTEYSSSGRPFKASGPNEYPHEQQL